MKIEHRKKSLNSSMKSDNSQQENSSPSLLEQLLHLGNSDTSIPALWDANGWRCFAEGLSPSTC